MAAQMGPQPRDKYRNRAQKIGNVTNSTVYQSKMSKDILEEDRFLSSFQKPVQLQASKRASFIIF